MLRPTPWFGTRLHLPDSVSVEGFFPLYSALARHLCILLHIESHRTIHGNRSTRGRSKGVVDTRHVPVTLVLSFKNSISSFCALGTLPTVRMCPGVIRLALPKVSKTLDIIRVIPLFLYMTHIDTSTGRYKKGLSV